MVFFMFGPSYKSWAIGNNVWTYHKSLPLGAYQLFEDKRVNGSNIEWVSMGLNGLVYFSCYRQSGFSIFGVDRYAPRLSYRTENPYLVADTNITLASSYNFGARSVNYIGFSPGGGWVITYSDKTVRLSMTGTFSNRFHELAAPYLRTRGHVEPQQSQIRYVFFGEGDSVIIVLWTGHTLWEGVPTSLEGAITSSAQQGRILGKGTSLCQWDSRFYFAQFEPVTAAQSYGTTYAWSIWPNTPLTDILIREVTDETVPVSLTAPAIEYFMDPPPPQPGVHTSILKTSPLAMPWLNTYEPSIRKEIEECMRSGAITQLKIMFENSEPYEGAGYISREIAMACLLGSINKGIGDQAKLGVEVEITESDLNRMWDLAENNHDGKMNFEEFGHLFILGMMHVAGLGLDKRNAPKRTVASGASKSGYYKNPSVPEPPESPPPAYATSNSSSSQPMSSPRIPPRVPPRLPPRHVVGSDLAPINSSATERKAYVLWTCDYCSSNITQGIVYTCSICNDGSWGMCKHCYSYRRACPGQHILSISDVGPEIQSSVTEQRTYTSLTCDYCSSNIAEMGYSCFICNNGDFNMCKFCYQYRGACSGGHPLSITKIVPSLESQMNGMNLGGNETSKSGSSNQDTSRNKEAEQLKDSLMSSILCKKPNVKWEDVAGLESAKEELQEAVVLPLKFPELFTGKRKARRGMLLYGPPGTGKTYLANAIATEVDSTLFSISSSDVLSKWLGESEGLIKQLFAIAREKKPSIIFIDEIEALCGSRDGPGANPHLHGLKTELLVQMDGIGHDNDGVLLLGATNLPWTLDPAVRRRFQRKIYIPLPDERARRQLFQISAKKWDVKLSQRDYVELGRLTDGFSGSDISNALQDALDVPIKKIQTSRYYKRVQDNGKQTLTPCKKDDAGAVAMTWKDVPKSMLKEPDVVREDLFSVLPKVKASVMLEELQKYEDWTKQFGSEGA